MTDYDVPAWNDVITGLRARGIAAKLETWQPGWWSVIVLTEDPNELVMIGTHRFDDEDRWEASIGLDDGPLDRYLVYRQITNDTILVTEDHYTDTTELDELASAIRAVMAAPLKDIG